jgi:hypothetical protein
MATVKQTKPVLIFIFVIFLLTRIIYLIGYPLFTDESSNIRWGLVMIHNPELRFASLIAQRKQPLADWLFGYGAQIIRNPQIGARLISLCTAIVSFFTLYFWSNRLYGKKIAIIAALLITASPLFVHFQTLALMEGMVLLDTILIFWLTQEYLNNRNLYILFLIGLSYAFGLWVKTDTIIPIFLSGTTLLIFNLQMKPFKWRKIFNLLIPLLTGIIFIIPLVIQNNFTKLISEPSFFTFTLNEILHLPVKHWFLNLIQISFCTFIYLGLISIIGLVVYYWKVGINKNFHLSVWMVIQLCIPLFLNKILTTRYYIGAFIPMIILIALGINTLISDNNRFFKYIITGAIIWNISLSGILLFNAQWFFGLFPKSSIFGGERNYALGWTSGYATRQALTYLTSSLPDSPTIIGVPDYPGNPTDYLVSYYFYNQKHVTAIINTESDLNQFRNNFPNIPIYYATRDSIPTEISKNHLVEIQKFGITDSGDNIRIYRTIY